MKYTEINKITKKYPYDWMGDKFAICWSCRDKNFGPIHLNSEFVSSILILKKCGNNYRTVLYQISEDVYYLEKLLLTYFNKI